MKSPLLLRCGVVVLLVCGFVHMAYAQNSKVRGYAYDENNERLWGVTIVLTELDSRYEFAGTLSQKDGSFEVDSVRDSVLLKAFFFGYKPVEMKVPRDCEIDIHMQSDPGIPKDLFIGPPAIPRRLRIGYIFDAKGKPVAGASIESRGDGENKDYEVESRDDGYFEIKGSDFAELTIRAEGHKPLKLDMETLKKKKTPESMHVKHDGLFIVIDFNW